jgi:hypothetical protein
MTVELANEIWSELKRYVNTVDRDDAAETFVSLLIDNDIGPDEIKAVFKSDSDIKKALTSYLRDQDELDDEEELDEVNYDDEDDDDEY